MLTWETVDEDAIEPRERYRAVSGKYECRIFYRPEAAVPSILDICEVSEDGVQKHVFLGNYPTDDDAKQAAEQWVSPHRSDDSS